MSIHNHYFKTADNKVGIDVNSFPDGSFSAIVECRLASGKLYRQRWVTNAFQAHQLTEEDKLYALSTMVIHAKYISGAAL